MGRGTGPRDACAGLWGRGIVTWIVTETSTALQDFGKAVAWEAKPSSLAATFRIWARGPETDGSGMPAKRFRVEFRFFSHGLWYLIDYTPTMTTAKYSALRFAKRLRDVNSTGNR